MTVNIHHVSIFVADMDRAIHLFRDILGFEMSWHIPEAGGKQLSALLGIEDMKAELAYLKSGSDGISIELARLIRPVVAPQGIRFGSIGTMGVSIAVPDVDSLYDRLNEEGWIPLTRCLSIRSPDGGNLRVFCIRLENCLTLEFMEQIMPAGKNNCR